MPKVDLYSLGLKSQYTFESLVVGPHNQMAAAASLEVMKKPGETYNPLFIFGAPGIGKTHLMQAVANALLIKNPKTKIKYISAERFASEVIGAISEDNVMAVRQHYSDLDLLILDDMQFLSESKTAQGEFFHIFNNLHEANKQLIMAADRSPNQLVALDPSIRSRLEWGLAVDVKIPDVSTRVQILKAKEAVQGLSLNDQILQFAADHLNSNVRELEGFLKRLHAYVTLSHQELTMDLVQQVIREVLPTNAVFQPGIAAGPVSAPASTPVPPPPPISISPVPPVVKEPATNGHYKKEEPVVPPVPKPEVKMATPVNSPLEEIPLEFPEVTPSDIPPGTKEIGAVFFYPAAKEKELDTVHQKFQDVIKKHKLKFRLKRVFSHGYPCKGKINYSSFVDVCKQNKVPVAIVIGPPPDALLPEQDFYDLLSVTLDVQGISLQLVNWAEIEKDYRYLNLALDIALVRSR